MQREEKNTLTIVTFILNILKHTVYITTNKGGGGNEDEQSHSRF